MAPVILAFYMTMVGDLSQSRLYDQSAYWDENPGYSLFPVNLTNGVFTVRNKEATIDGCEPKEREVIPDFWDPSQPPRIVPEVDCIGPPNCGYWVHEESAWVCNDQDMFCVAATSGNGPCPPESRIPTGNPTNSVGERRLYDHTRHCIWYT